MEVYLGDEYYATGRGEKMFTVKHGRSVVLSFFHIDSVNNVMRLYSVSQIRLPEIICSNVLIFICQ